MSWHPDVGDIQGLVDGELDARARRAIEAHLARCERCRRLAGRLREVAAAVHAVGRAPVPAALDERILAAVAGDGQCDDLACAECTALASAYIDGELEGAERDGFEAHVFACDACYATLKQMERAAQVLRETPRRAAPAGLHERITAAIAAERRAASIFTWRRVAAAGVAVAAAAAVLAALLMPHGRAPDGPMSPPSMVAEAPAGMPAEQTTEPETDPAQVERAADSAAAPPASVARTEEAPPVRAPRSSRPRSTLAHRAVPDVGPPAPMRTSDVEPPSTPSETELVTSAPPAAALAPAPEPRPAVAPQPPAPARAPEPTATPAPAVPEPTASPAPTPELAAPAEPVLAAAPRTTGPDTHAAAAASPEPAPVTVERSVDEPMRIAVVPQQRGSRTLYRAAPEPSAAIERAAERVRDGQSPGWDDPRTGIELR